MWGRWGWPRRERPERATSTQPRATPWVSAYKRQRPVRAKVWANGWLLLLPLQGVGYGDMVPRALPWARDLLPFQGARGEGWGDSTVAHFARKVRGTKVAAQHCSSLCSQSEGREGCGERPERAASSEPRATPWVSAYKRQRPVRAKVWANGWLLLLPLQGVGNGDMVPRALPWARDLLPFQGARGEGCGDSIVAHFARKVRGAKVAASALKGRSVLSSGQRPGYQRINANAL